MSDRPNIIILILDTLRAKNMSSYGYQVRTTPCLDAFATESVLFRRAFSAATWTVPSHASLLSGLYTSQHRIENIQGDRHFNEAIITLPEALRFRGYRSAAFSQNMLFDPNNHLDTGFDEFHNMDELVGSHLLLRLNQRLADGSTPLLRPTARYLRKMVAPRMLLDKMCDWVRANDEQSPFFLFANVLAPHFPWTLPPKFLPRGREFSLRYLLKPEFVTLKRQWEFNSGKREVTERHRQIWRLLYDASIRHVDSEVDRFLNRLRKLKGWQNTIVVITSDHGEMIGDYRDIVGHMLSVHDNLIHVPLIVHHPAYPSGLQVEGVVQTLDLYPSVLEWAGVPASQVHPVQLQRPSLSMSVAAAADRSGFAFAEEDYTDSYDLISKLVKANPNMDPEKYPRQQIAVRSATHKYIWYNDRSAEFFDLTVDPNEEHNLINGNAKTDQPSLRQLQDALENWRSSLELFPPRVIGDAGKMDAVILQRLRSLGYVE